MLHYSTIYPETLQLLKKLQNIKFLSDHLLVGGTALSLQIGHRISIDLDLFAYSQLNVSTILDHINQLGKIKILNQSTKVLNLFIDDVKVDFVSYQYHFIEKPVLIDQLRLASIKDIAAMKLAAITSRGTKKDFIDLFFLLEHFTLPQLFEFYNSKFEDGNEFLVLKSLTYFEDADIEPMPKMIKNIGWNDVKIKIIEAAKTRFI